MHNVSVVYFCLGSCPRVQVVPQKGLLLPEEPKNEREFKYAVPCQYLP
jgi:hypothetical protein